MKLLKEITESDAGVELIPGAGGSVRYAVRKAARAVAIDDTGRIALLYARNRGYHKLPGGGIEEGEDAAAAVSKASAFERRSEGDE